MAKTVTIDNLADEIAAAVKVYTDAVSQAVEKEVENTAKTVVEDIKDRSPVDTGEYRRGWSRRKEGEAGKISYRIYNRLKGSIAHLLEFGHAKVGGGRVREIPHIRPAYDRHVPEMEKRIEQIIRRGG